MAEIAHWAVWFAILGAAAFLARLRTGPRAAIWFAPKRPRPWYLVRAAALWAGLPLARSEQEASAAFYFEDSTHGEPPETSPVARINFGCADVSKSRVQATFGTIFGYPLAVEPQSCSGLMVAKSEKNGVHDGRLVQGPVLPEPGLVYQRLVETTQADGFARDLRTLITAGRPLLVWVKVKPAGRRFAIQNRRADLRRPEEVFSAEELARIADFAAAMGLDWGGLDILRDRNDGRIYVVDVNKTDVGPVIALSWADKIRSMQLLASALRDLVKVRAPEAAPEMKKTEGLVHAV